MDLIEHKRTFEKLLLKERIFPLTVAYHGSACGIAGKQSDLDVVLIMDRADAALFRKLHRIQTQLDTHLGVSIVAAREAGTVFGGLKYQDALHRHLGFEERHPHAYYKIATLNEQFRRYAIELNRKKCFNIAKIITKTINNFLGCNLGIRAGSFAAIIASLNRNLSYFYDCEKIKPGWYRERVRVRR